MIWDSAIAKCAAIGREELDHLLDFSAEEHPVVAQLGGSTPELMERAAAVCKLDYGYDVVNLNAGCPAKSGNTCFGAGLMKEPELIGRLCRAIGRGSRSPATLKCRTGVDDHDSAEHLAAVIDAASGASVEHVIVHARKAILSLDTLKNRTVPPLRYGVVHGLVDAYPHLRFTLNGGIKSLGAACEQIAIFNVHGVMVGRQVLAEPWLLADADRVMFGAPNRAGSREEVLAAYASYADEVVEHAAAERRRTVWKATLKPLINLFAYSPCNKLWKQQLQEAQHAAKGREDAVPPSAVIEAVSAPLRASAVGLRELEAAPPDDDRLAACR